MAVWFVDELPTKKVEARIAYMTDSAMLIFFKTVAQKVVSGSKVGVCKVTNVMLFGAPLESVIVTNVYVTMNFHANFNVHI